MAARKNTVPFEIRDLDKENNDLLKKLFKGEPDSHVRVGPKGYLFKNNYRNLAADYYYMEITPDDIFIVTYPRSGTTWTQELIWLVANDTDFEKAKAVPLIERFPFLDMNGLLSPSAYEEFVELNKHDPKKLAIVQHCNKRSDELVGNLPSPRFIKTHVPLSLLPPHLLDTAKVVFVARDPRDVAVSYYHLHRLFKPDNYNGDFKTYWDLFMKDLGKSGGWRSYFDDEMTQLAKKWITERLDTDLRFPDM